MLNNNKTPTLIFNYIFNNSNIGFGNKNAIDININKNFLENIWQKNYK